LKHPRWVLAAAATVTGLLAVAGWVRPVPPVHWILAYAGWPKQGRSVYTVDDFVRELAVVDTTGKPVGWLSTGVLLTQISATSGRGFYPGFGTGPADGTDWQQYVDSILGPGGAVARLDSAVAYVSSQVSWSPGPIPVALVIPYPDTGNRTVTFDGHDYSMAAMGPGREELVKAYLTRARQLFAAGKYAHLRFDAFYWLRENCYAFDTMLVKDVAKAVHEQGSRFLWIPYFRSYNFQHWKGLGFDEAWLQPNFFFHTEIPAVRVDSATAMAKANRMGMEIELDRRLITNPQFANRLDPYLDAFSKDKELNSRTIAMYDGAGAIIDMSKSKDPRVHAAYQRLTDILAVRRDAP